MTAFRTLSFVLLACSATTALAQHTGDAWVARSAAGQLKLSPSGYVPEANYHKLSPVNGLLKGWTDGNPGFDLLITPQPLLDTFTLDPGANVWLQVVAMDAAFRLIDSAFDIVDAPGEVAYLGTGSGLHAHNTWHINRLDPAYDPNQCVWTATFVLVDTAGYHATSAPFTFYFTNANVRSPLTPATGDFNASGAANAADLPALAKCFSGPGVRPSPNDPAVTTCEVQCLNAFDFDNDHDLDVADFAAFQAAYAGA